MANSLFSPSTLKRGTTALRTLDPVMHQIIETAGPLRTMKEPESHFQSLLTAILSQQISTKAADTIRGRLFAAVDHKIVPSRFVKLTEEDYRAQGVSRQKSGYIRDLSQHFVDDPVFFKHLADHEDEEVITKLVEIRGIGRWSAQMFLIFALGRPDVFAPDDLGLKIAIRKHYRIRKETRQRLEKLARPWAPWRSLGSLYLWKSLDHK